MKAKIGFLTPIALLVFCSALSAQIADYQQDPPKWFRPPINVSRGGISDRITPPPTGEIHLEAEWEECEGVIVRYPFNWGSTIFSSMVDEIQEVAIIYILVANSTQQNNCLNYLNSHNVPIENIEFIQVATNSVWTRDYGPWFVRQADSSIAIIDMPYAWANWPLDDFVPEFLESYWGLDYYGPNFEHDGGNMMTDGHGLMMMSTYVNQANPGMTNAQICQIYQDYFGQDTIYIFQEIAFDLTGHIDLWSKIMNDTTILVAQMQANDPNYQLVENHCARMDSIPTYNGGTFHIVRCPMPPLTPQGGGGYYKSYLNSLLINGKAIVPIYNLEWDNAALQAYQTALGPEWEVVGINCNGIAFAGGAIHCTTIGVPRHDQDYLVDVDFTFEPVNPPIVIPATGGSFNYMAQVENLETEEITFDFWAEVTLPNGNVIGPLILRERLDLASLGTITRTLTQLVPATAPAGNYSFTGFIGSYLPRVISAEASFDVVKTAD